MSVFGPGTPMVVNNPAQLWKGTVRTNGILMGNVNSRVPAITEGFSAFDMDPSNPQYGPDVVTWGCGVWRDVNEVTTRPGRRYLNATGKAHLLGVFKFNQGWQASNPVQPYGSPTYSTGTVIRKGLVGYSVAMVSPAQAGSYMAYLQGDTTYDVDTVRTMYDDWMEAWQDADAGSRLALFVDNASGFPVVSVVDADDVGNPTLADCTFAGWESILAKEHGRVYFDINL